MAGTRRAMARVVNLSLTVVCQPHGMRRLLPTLALLAFISPACAAEKPEGEKKAEKSEKGEKDPKGGKPGTNVDMPYLMAPMTDAEGKLAGYAYISSRLTATSDTIALSVREKIAFIQDVFVRDVNTLSVAKKDDPTAVDQAGLEARLLADAKKVMGAGKVASIALVQVQIAPLHPTETPMLHAPNPNEIAPPADSAQKAHEPKKHEG